MTAVRCICCQAIYVTPEAYLDHSCCSGSPRDTATVSAVEQPTTAPGSPDAGAVVIPFSRRPRWQRPTEPCPA